MKVAIITSLFTKGNMEINDCQDLVFTGINDHPYESADELSGL